MALRRAWLRRRVLAAVAAATALAAVTGPAPAVGAVPDIPAVGAVPDIPAGCAYGLGIGGLVLAQVERPALPAVRAVAADLGGRVSGGVPGLSLVELAFPTAAAADAAVAVVGRLPGVRFAERERGYRPARTTNDPLRSHQWGLGAVNAYRAWDRETGTRRSVTVAVLDTGVDYGHPDLAGRTIDGPNAVGGTSSRDDEGHGTLVAGVIGAVPNNRVGVAGLHWAPKLLSVKVLRQNGSATECSVVNGYLDAVEAGATVVNMSLSGTGQCPLAYEAAMRWGEQQNVVTVVASGNEGGDGNPRQSPASCPFVLAVGAYDRRLRIAPFSGHADYVNISAPGVDIASTWYERDSGQHLYAQASGTSMAAPFVAAVAALLRSKHPTWTAQQVRDRITSTARDLGPRGRDEWYGWGGIDAAKALS